MIRINGRTWVPIAMAIVLLLFAGMAMPVAAEEMQAEDTKLSIGGYNPVRIFFETKEGVSDGIYPANASMSYQFVRPDNSKVKDRQTRNDCWTEDQIQKFNELFGQDISAGEFYDLVDPEFLNSLPEKLQESYYNTKVEWPVPPSGTENKITLTSQTSKTTYSGKGSVLLSCGSFACPIGNSIKFFTQSVSCPPTTFIEMYDKSTLCKYENGHYEYVECIDGIGHLCTAHYLSHLEAVEPGTYIVLGEHTGVSMPGILDPPWYGPVYSYSGYITI